MHEQDKTQQVETVIRLLTNKQFDKTHPVFKATCDWLLRFPPEAGEERKARLLKVACNAFQITETELYAKISGIELPTSRNGAGLVSAADSREVALERILPKGGWFEDYAEYTRYTESPLSFHIFSSLCALGVACGRRIWKSQGFFNIYPNYTAILIGPTGKVKKTSAVNIAQKLIKETAVAPLMADKLTPEALVASLKDCGHQFVYAPEMSVLLGRQRYNEGLITMILRLLDCPDHLKVRTLARGEEDVYNVALTWLGGSTLSLLSESTPDEVTSGGFLNRFVLVVENETERCYPEPIKGSKELENRLLSTMRRVHEAEGEMVFSTAAKQFYDQWYRDRSKQLRSNADDITAEVTQRLPDHLIRTAMLIHLAQCYTLTICEECMKSALALMQYTERATPQMVTALNTSASAQDTDYVEGILIRLGGAADHSKALRRASNKMDAARFKRAITTLTEAGRVYEEKRGTLRFYVVRNSEGE